MSHFILIRGPGGSGKSTIAKKIQKQSKHKTAILCPDLFYWGIAGKENNKEVVYEALYRLIDLYLSKDYDVILEGILSSKIHNELRVKKCIDLAQKYKSKVFTFFLTLPLDEAIKRDSEREVSMGDKMTKEIFHKSIDSKLDSDIEINTFENDFKNVLKIIHSNL